MADQVKYPGRLIAVDGSRGKDTAAAADAIVAAAASSAGVECAISRWDASGLFGELAATARGDRNISMRTLSLVYAADLAFRLRWEIRPVLEAGGVVVAAPYIETAVAFGAGCGLERGVAAAAAALCAAGRRARPRRRAQDRSAVEAAHRSRLSRVLRDDAGCVGAAASYRRRARREMMRDARSARAAARSSRSSNKGVDAIAKAITDSRPDASRRSASRPRNGRK